MKLSYPMQRVLRSLLNGQPASHHCRTMSDYGGLTRTIFALRCKGLIDHDYKLTKLGREAAESIWKAK